MELIIIIVLAVILASVIGFFLWDRFRREQRWKEQGDALSKVVGEKLEGSMGVFGALQERLGELAKGAKDIEEVGKSISRLQEALRAPKSRGGFGEVGLATLLMNHFPGSYKLQRRFANGKIVDAVLYVGKNEVPIDSKFPFPLEDFERMVTTHSEDERTRLRKAFTPIMKKHVDDVSEYIQTDEGTFDFALMYIPAENIYYETIAQSDICSYCRERRVFPVSPNTFYVYLQAIVLGLRGLSVERNARDILGRLQRLQDDLKDFQGDYKTLGRHIYDAATKYDKAGRKLNKLGDKLRLAGETPTEKLPEGDDKAGEQDKLP